MARTVRVDVGLDGSPRTSLDDLAVLTARIYPSNKRRAPCPCPPHPFAILVTNLRDGKAEPCWRQIVVPSLNCHDAASCSMAAKQVKMPLIAPPAVISALSTYDRVLYLDDKITIDGPDELRRLLAPAVGDWSLMLRAHEGHEHGHTGVEAEFRAAMMQPRYRAREAQIRAFIEDEQAHVGRDGMLHNTGLLLWNMRSDAAKALSRFWYDATMRTSAECQLTFYYAFQRWQKHIVTVPFAQEGVRWDQRDTWGEYKT